MAKKRLEQAEKRRQREKTTSTANSNVSKTALKEKIEHLPEEDKLEFKKAFEEYDKAMERQLKVLRADVQLYRTLSTAGITAATFSHESNGNPIKVINITIQSLESRIRKRVDPEVFNSYFAKQIASIKNALKSLAVLGSATLKLLAHEKRRPIRLNIHGVINEVVDTFKPFLDGRNISTVISFAEGNPFLRGTEAAVESIVTNLLNNSIVAFENQAAGNRKI
jgi:signal transduction histidine kinase